LLKYESKILRITARIIVIKIFVTIEAINKRLKIDKEKFIEAKYVADFIIENINLEKAVNDIIGKI
jgi:hypothetical protein